MRDDPVHSGISGVIKALLLRVVNGLVWLFCITWRVKIHNADELYSRHDSGRLSIVALWHDQLLPLSFAHRGMGYGTLASQSKDGELIARFLEMWGFRAARGSSTRGGARAIVEMKRLMESGTDMTLAVDGPKGPRHEVKPGIIYLAKQVDCVLIPVTMSARHYKRFASWDRFVLPLPFTRVDIYFGDSIKLSPEKDAETMERERLLLETAMLELTETCSPEIAGLK